MVDFPGPPNFATLPAAPKPFARILHSCIVGFSPCIILPTIVAALTAPIAESPVISHFPFLASFAATLAAWTPEPMPGSIETTSAAPETPAEARSVHCKPSRVISAYSPAAVPPSPVIPPAIGAAPKTIDATSAISPAKSALSALDNSLHLKSKGLDISLDFLASWILVLICLVLAVDPEAFANPPPGANFLIIPPCLCASMSSEEFPVVILDLFTTNNAFLSGLRIIECHSSLIASSKLRIPNNLQRLWIVVSPTVRIWPILPVVLSENAVNNLLNLSWRLLFPKIISK